MLRKNKLKFGIPAGSLRDSMVQLFKDAGYDFKISESPLSATIDDSRIECFFDRANEIARLVNRGVLDGGVVSSAALAETKVKVLKICEIGTPNFAWHKSKIVLAVPQGSKIRSIKDLEGKRIITRLPEITRDFLNKNKISAEIEITNSSAEPKAAALKDALVEFVNTGATLKFYNFKILKIILENTNILFVIASPKAIKNKWKREKMENLGMLLKGARIGQEMVGLMLHASNEMLEEIFKKLPALKRPTITHLRGENWFEVFTVINKEKTRSLIPTLKKIGCEDIVEFSLNKVII
jgi:ATP phosphoribosyltransferase